MKRTLDDVRTNLDHVGCDNATALEMCAEIERLWAEVERLGRCHRIVAKQVGFYKPQLPDFEKVEIYLGILRAAERCAGQAPWETHDYNQQFNDCGADEMNRNAAIARAILAPIENDHSYGFPELDAPIVAALDAKDAEIERLRRFLEIAVDAYEDEHGSPNRETHWAAQARAALDNQQSTQEDHHGNR